MDAQYTCTDAMNIFPEQPNTETMGTITVGCEAGWDVSNVRLNGGGTSLRLVPVTQCACSTTSRYGTAAMYVAVEDTTGTSAVVVHEDTDATLIETWQGWTISLEEFTDQGVNLTDVRSIAIGFGDRDNPQPGGTGIVYFDDIQLCTDPCPIADDPNKCEVRLTRYFVDGSVTVTYVSSPYTFYKSKEAPVEEINWDYVSSDEKEVAVVYIYFKNGNVLQISCSPGADKCEMQFPQLIHVSGTPGFTFGELTVEFIPR